MKLDAVAALLMNHFYFHNFTIITLRKQEFKSLSFFLSPSPHLTPSSGSYNKHRWLYLFYFLILFLEDTTISYLKVLH